MHACDVRRRSIGVETESRESVEQGVEKQGALEPGEVHTNAHMGAVPEPDVRLAFPEYVETSGVVPPGLVVVGASQIDRHHRALGYRDSVDLESASGVGQEVKQRSPPREPSPDGRGRRLRSATTAA